MPLGKLVSNEEPRQQYPNLFDNKTIQTNRCVNYNEFIVYDESHVCIRYIVQFR